MDVDPSQAATGDAQGDAMAGGDPAAGAGADPEGPLGPLDVLFRTKGGAPLPEIQQEYDSDKPTALMIRGLMKMAGADQFPAIADLAAGLLLMYMRVADTSQGAEGAEGADDFTREWGEADE